MSVDTSTPPLPPKVIEEPPKIEAPVISIDPPVEKQTPSTNGDAAVDKLVKTADKPIKTAEWLPPSETLSVKGHNRVGSLQNWQLPRSSAASLRVQETNLTRAGSIGGSSMGRRSLFLNRDGDPVGGSAFINGAGTVGPETTPEIDESVHLRAASADAVLTPKQQEKIAKGELANTKRLSKIIKEEGKVEKRALGVSISELSGLQKVQKAAVKRESKCQASHNKALAKFHKLEAALLDIRTKYEAAQAVLGAEADALDTARANARQTTERMQEKSQEIESLRAMLGVDQREREVKMAELVPKKSSRWGK